MSASGRKFIANALFRQRALAEAARYGSDPGVFVRELLQNSRDAGARHVELTVSEEDSRQRITCRDDGCGMAFEHARQYLFALYASSKEDRRAQAGKFGIGFWSVLRFKPTSVVIRSRAASEPAWEVTLDGDLEWASVTDSAIGGGTEIVLERSADGGDGLAEQVCEAARRYGRFLTRRDRSGKPLRVTVDGRRVNADFTLPAPCARFGGKGFRGVVGLGPKPRVELFAHGLFVRSADSLQDLQELGEPGRRSGAEDALADLPSLAPQVLLDSTELDLLLARGDARQDKGLRRMLRAAERAFDRLVSRQLQALRPQPWYRSWWGVVRDRLEPWIDGALDRASLSKTAAVSLALAGLFVAGAVLAALWFEPPAARLAESAATAGAASPAGPARSRFERLHAVGRVSADGARAGGATAGGATAGGATAGGATAGGATAGGATAGGATAGGATAGDLTAAESEDDRAVEVSSARREPAIRSYSDLGRRYRGPHPGQIDGGRAAVALTYRPESQPVLFNALVIDELGGSSWNATPVDDNPSAYRDIRCRRDCLEVELQLSAGGALRIPVPTGHRLDVSPVLLDGVQVPVFETVHGEAILRLGRRTRGVLEYRTGPSAAPDLPVGESGSSRSYPAPRRLAAAAEGLRGLPVRERVAKGLLFVAENVVYDRSPEAARVYLDDDGRLFAETALEVGAGDCDVQNGLLVELLRLAGVEARLALGYVGLNGTALPGLHAWVEYLDDGRWNAADASAAAVSPGADGGGRPIDAGGRLPVEVLAGIAPPPAAGWSPSLAAGALLLLTAGVAGVAVRRRTAAAGLELDPAGDLAALLGGALRHPGAFSALPAMSHGRFVPLLGRSDAISIDRARRLAAKRRLFRSSTASRLARDAVARGTPVIDSSTAEGRVLSLALGAIDLDHWSDLLDQSSESGLGRWMNLELELLDEPWRVRAVPGLGEPMTELALEDLGLGRRLILIDPQHAELAPARRFLPDHPETAAFTAFDLVVHRLDLTDRDRSRILAASARRALSEVHG
ncbi:MAG: transglutaminase domain-containing protein [Thermoanaerobaculia bacterium]